MAEEEKYFKRKINEGTVKRSHACSFDPSIKLEMIVQSGRRTVDYIMRLQQEASEKENKADFKKAAESEFKDKISALKINGKPVIYEDLITSFDDDEMFEVMTFINDGDMSIYGGKPAPKNA